MGLGDGRGRGGERTRCFQRVNGRLGGRRSEEKAAEWVPTPYVSWHLPAVSLQSSALPGERGSILSRLGQDEVRLPKMAHALRVVWCRTAVVVTCQYGTHALRILKTTLAFAKIAPSIEPSGAVQGLTERTVVQSQNCIIVRCACVPVPIGQN